MCARTCPALLSAEQAARGDAGAPLLDLGVIADDPAMPRIILDQVAQHSLSRDSGGGLGWGRPLPRSLYADTARPAPATPPLDGDKRVSVAVIGGGFTGLSAALHLAERGVDVAVLEAHEPGWGASGRNGGQVNPGLKHDPDTVEQDFGSDLGRRMVALSGNAPNVGIRTDPASPDRMPGAAIRHVARRHFPARRRRHPRDRRAMGTARCARRFAGRASRCTRRPAARVTSAHCLTGVAGRSIRSAMRVAWRRRRCRRALRYSAARRRGACSATALCGTWTTPTGSVRADKLVLATNGYSDDLWSGLRRSIVPVFSAIVASEPLPDALARDIMPTRSVLYEMGRVTVYYRLDRDNRLLMGGRCVQRDIAEPRRTALSDRLRPPLVAGAARHWLDACVERTARGDARPLSACARTA